MALDVYVGSLTRYYTGRWKSIIAQYAEGEDPDCVLLEGGVERMADSGVKTAEGQVQRIEIKTQRKRLHPEAAARQEIENWRRSLNEALGARLQAPLDWPEDEDGTYFTDKPGWDAYRALKIWAAYEEHPEFEAPAMVPEKWTSDPAYELSSAEQAPTRYPTLLRSAFWLPGEHSFTAQGKTPNGVDVTFGFTAALLQELRELNARTWDAEDISGWFAYGKKREDGFESCAKFGLAVLYALGSVAKEDNLPMILDW